MAKAKAKGSKGSSKAAKPASKSVKKPAPKAAAKAKAATRTAPKAPKGSAKPAKAAAPKVTKASKPKGSAAPPVVAEPILAPSTPPADANGASTGGIIRPKKKVKRGAPPMLPRRMARRPLPPNPDGQPPAPPRVTTSPGSLHAPARAPEGAEGLKARLMSVISDLARLRGLRRTLQKNFWEAGLILAHLSSPELYQAKGYGSWESFLEREIERELTIGRTVAIDLVRIVKLFQREPAEELGLERLRGALKALWPEVGASPSTPAGPPGTAGATGSGGV